MDEDTAKQHRKQYDWLKQYQYQKGQTGNSKGAPKGQRLKTIAEKFFKDMSDEDKAEYLSLMNPLDVWKMAEGNPKQDTDLTSGGKPISTGLSEEEKVKLDKLFNDK